MRKTWCSWNHWCTSASSARALTRSWPKGFSTTKRRYPSVSSASPAAPSCEAMGPNSGGTVDR